MFKRVSVPTKNKDFQPSYMLCKKDTLKHKYTKLLIFERFKIQKYNREI